MSAHVWVHATTNSHMNALKPMVNGQKTKEATLCHRPVPAATSLMPTPATTGLAASQPAADNDNLRSSSPPQQVRNMAHMQNARLSVRPRVQ